MLDLSIHLDLYYMQTLAYLWNASCEVFSFDRVNTFTPLGWTKQGTHELSVEQ